jgi:hypothetical protein
MIAPRMRPSIAQDSSLYWYMSYPINCQQRLFMRDPNCAGIAPVCIYSSSLQHSSREMRRKAALLGGCGCCVSRRYCEWQESERFLTTFAALRFLYFNRKGAEMRKE